MNHHPTNRLTRHQDEIVSAEKASGSVGFWLGVVVGTAAAYVLLLVAWAFAGLIEIVSRFGAF